MKTLTNSSLVLDKKNRDTSCLFSSYDEKDVLRNRPRSFKVGSQKVANLGFLYLVSPKHRGIQPVSSLPSEPQTDIQNAETRGQQDQETFQTKTVHIKFQLQKECLFGEHFFIVGDDPMFGSWDPSNAIPLNWSDGNYWTVELDILIGKLIQFKFILKGTEGDLLWQPGPDRVFQTFETANKITVFEDWDNAESQEIKEELLANQNGSPPVSSEKFIVADNLTYPIIDLVPYSDPGSLIPGYDTYPEQQQPSEKEQSFVNETPSQGKPSKAIVADIITYQEETPNGNGSTNFHSEETITYPYQESVVILDNNPKIAEGASVNNSTAAMITETSSIQEILIDYEGDPVLVPGLSPTPALLAHKEPTQYEEDAGERIDSDGGATETKDHNMPEINEKQDTKVENREGTTKMVSHDEEENVQPNKSRENFQLAKIEEQDGNNILHNHLQWGHKAFEKFLNVVCRIALASR